jgi:3-oxoacyl-[acyl-carrier-protein] synthase II
MPSSSRRAVLTGLGIISPIGLNPADFWESLSKRRNGIVPLTCFNVDALPTRFGGEIRGFDAKSFVEKKERKSLKVMSRTVQLAVAAAQVALDDARVDKTQLDPSRFGVEFGAGLISSELEELGVASQLSVNGERGLGDLRKWGDQGLRNMPPLWMLKYLPNMLACHVSILHNAQGPNNTITESDVASLLALGEAYRILVRDVADFFLVGGADSKLNPLSLVRHTLFLRFSRRNEEPSRACRPFDLGRDGLVPGEGAGVFVIEELEHARRRNARIYAEIIGYGSAFDRDRSGAGLARAIRAALAEAQVGAGEIDHINAHGFSDKQGDIWEARGLQEVFGNCKTPVPVFAPKSYFGALGAGGSTAELAASILAVEHGMLPPTLNYEHPDPECPIYVQADFRPVKERHVLKVAFTEMGQCAAMVLRKWPTGQ